MSRRLAILWAMIPLGVLTGCNGGVGGTRRVLGPVSYDKAFAASRVVMSQYFSLAEVDPRAGLIKSRPRLVEAGRLRLSTDPPGRQVATLRLRADGEYVIARLVVVIHREGSHIHKYVGEREENYSGVPNRTPAEIEAATTAEQNQAWQAVRYDHQLERTILRQITGALHPAEAPTSAPNR